MTVDVRGKSSVITIGKYELTLDALSDESIGKLDSYVQRRILETAEAASRNIHEQARDKILAIAVREAAIGTFMSEIGRKYIATPEGMSVILCLLASKNHPNLDPKDILLEMRNPENIIAVNKQFMALNNPSTSNLSNGDAASKKKKRKELNKEKERLKKEKEIIKSS